MNRGELIASVRAEFELLERLGGAAGVREQDRERLYNMLSEPAQTRAVEPIQRDNFPVCAKEFVLFVFNFVNVQPRRGNHTTRRMKRRMGDKMKKNGNKLFFRLSDAEIAFDCLLRVLAHDSCRDEIVTGTRVSSEVLQNLRAHKTRILELFALHLNSTS
jgi:hypothetical protein